MAQDVTKILSDIGSLQQPDRHLLAEKMPDVFSADDLKPLLIQTSNAPHLDDTTRTDIARKMVAGMRPESRRDLATSLGLRGPSRPARDRLWLIVIIAFAVVLVVSGITLAISVFVPTKDKDNQSAQMMLTVLTTTVGFLSGLFAPSPVAGDKDDDE